MADVGHVHPLGCVVSACKALTNGNLVVDLRDVVSVDIGDHGGWDVHVWTLEGRSHLVSMHASEAEATDQADGLRKTLRTWLA